MPRFSVKAVAKLSGVSAHTLRAWERRYGVISPTRSKGGRREYSIKDVEKLKTLNLLVEEGHSIGTLAPMNLIQLGRLVAEISKIEASSVASKLESHGIHSSLDDLFEALQAFDLEEIDRHILRARISTPARDFVLDVVTPLLAQTGKLVSEGKLDIAQEHALSAILRTHLGDLLSQVQKASNWASQQDSGLPRLVFATPEGDLHEFGILLAAILAGSMGFKFRYFGANMPAESLARAVAAVGAKVLVIGSVKADPARLVRPLGEYVAFLAKFLKEQGAQSLSIWIGGYCDFNLSTLKTDYLVKVASSLREFEQALSKFQASKVRSVRRT